MHSKRFHGTCDNADFLAHEDLKPFYDREVHAREEDGHEEAGGCLEVDRIQEEGRSQVGDKRREEDGLLEGKFPVDSDQEGDIDPGEGIQLEGSYREEGTVPGEEDKLLEGISQEEDSFLEGVVGRDSLAFFD